jgi:hypothetical protein
MGETERLTHCYVNMSLEIIEGQPLPRRDTAWH